MYLPDLGNLVSLLLRRLPKGEEVKIPAVLVQGGNPYSVPTTPVHDYLTVCGGVMEKAYTGVLPHWEFKEGYGNKRGRGIPVRLKRDLRGYRIEVVNEFFQALTLEEVLLFNTNLCPEVPS